MPCSHLYHNRGDPTLVKINVSITTGYLISGESLRQMSDFGDGGFLFESCIMHRNAGYVCLLPLVLAPDCIFGSF